MSPLSYSEFLRSLAADKNKGSWRHADSVCKNVSYGYDQISANTNAETNIHEGSLSAQDSPSPVSGDPVSGPC